MSNTSEPTSGPLPWLRTNIVLTTLLGIFIYVTFSVPATYFYDALGTTPGEVGFDYKNILSGSTIGLAVIVIAIVGALTYIAVYFSVAKNMAHIFYIYSSWSKSRPDLVMNYSYKDFNNKQFAQKLKQMKAKYKRTEPSWEELERRLSRSRELSQRENLTPTEAAEKAVLESQTQTPEIMHKFAVSYPFYPVTSPIDFWIRCSKPWLLVRAIVIAALTISTLSLIAVYQAGDIRNGNTFVGSGIGLFDYHAQPVYAKPASPDSEAYMPPSITCRSQVFLLGENSQNVVLYVPNRSFPDRGSTVRLPVSEVILNSQPC